MLWTPCKSSFQHCVPQWHELCILLLIFYYLHDGPPNHGRHIIPLHQDMCLIEQRHCWAAVCDVGTRPQHVDHGMMENFNFDFIFHKSWCRGMLNHNTNIYIQIVLTNNCFWEVARLFCTNFYLAEVPTQSCKLEWLHPWKEALKYPPLRWPIDLPLSLNKFYNIFHVSSSPAIVGQQDQQAE